MNATDVQNHINWQIDELRGELMRVRESVAVPVKRLTDEDMQQIVDQWYDDLNAGIISRKHGIDLEAIRILVGRVRDACSGEVKG